MWRQQCSHSYSRLVSTSKSSRGRHLCVQSKGTTLPISGSWLGGSSSTSASDAASSSSDSNSASGSGSGSVSAAPSVFHSALKSSMSRAIGTSSSSS